MARAFRFSRKKDRNVPVAAFDKQPVGELLDDFDSQRNRAYHQWVDRVAQVDSFEELKEVKDELLRSGNDSDFIRDVGGIIDIRFRILRLIEGEAAYEASRHSRYGEGTGVDEFEARQ